MIFVFGSNKRGIHGAGAASYARRYYGAIIGVGEGPTGLSYGIPTKHSPKRVMTFDEIRQSVTKFLAYATSRPDLEFQVTQVGCGLGGWAKEDIAPLFVKAPHNCLFDTKWQEFLPNGTRFWGSI